MNPEDVVIVIRVPGGEPIVVQRKDQLVKVIPPLAPSAG